MSSGPTDPDRGQGKGSNRDQGDPSEGFEDAVDSEQAEDAQQLLDEIEGNLENDVPDNGGGDGSSTSVAAVSRGSTEDPAGGEGEDEEQEDSGYQHIDDDPTNIVLSRDDLRDREVVEEVADAIEENAWGSDLTEEDRDQIHSLAEDGLTPDAPNHINLDRGVKFKPLGLSEDQETGASDTSMWLVTNSDGEEMFVTLDNSTVMGRPITTTELVNSFRESLPEDTREQVGIPDIAIDREREAVIAESAGADDSSSTNKYRPGTVEAEFDKDDYLSAVAAKAILGDTDIGGNIVASSQGDFHPIDYDLAGSDLKSEDESIRQDSDGFNADEDSVWENIQTKASRSVRRFDFDVEEDEIQAKTRELAENVDLDQFEQNLEESRNIRTRAKENVLRNVRNLRQGEI